MTMQRTIFFGPPGVGKGTAAAQVAPRLLALHLSTGDLLRAAVKAGTKLGKQAKGYMDAGQLVPDDLMVQLIRREIDQGNQAFILDGFPRTLPQADALDTMLEEAGLSLDGVLFFEADDDVLVNRICGRISCGSCGAVFHRDNNPPRQEGICDKCGEKLVTRPDDTEKVVRNRLQVYKQETEPLAEYYNKKGLLHRVDGSQTVHDVYVSLKKLFDGV